MWYFANTFFMKYMYWYGLYFLKVLLTTRLITALSVASHGKKCTV